MPNFGGSMLHGSADTNRSSAFILKDKAALQLLSLCLILVIYLVVVTVWLQNSGPASTDFYKFYSSARYYFEGKGIYTPVSYVPPKPDSRIQTIQTLHPNLNSPLHTLTFFPFAFLPFKIAFWIWCVISLGIGFLSLHLFARNAFQNISGQVWTGLSILLLLYFPSLINFMLGQYGFVVLLFTVLVWVLARKRKPALCGIVLGVAVCLKSFLGIYVLLFAVRRQWRPIAFAVGSFLVSNSIGLLVFGAAEYRQYIAQHSLVPLYVNSSWNASVMAYFSRIFGGAQNVPWMLLPQLTYIIVYCFAVALVLAVLWVSRPRQKEGLCDRFDLGFSLSTVAMLLISPYGWIYYFPCLLVPLVLSWRIASCSRRERAYKIALAAIWIVTSWPGVLIPPESAELNKPLIWFATAGIYFYALVGFVLVLLTLARTSVRSAGVSPNAA
jgi:hypothetical protein